MNEEVRFAGFWLRTGATVLDSLWLYGLIYAVLWLLLSPGLFNPEAPYTLTQFAFEWVIPLIVVMTFWVMKGATPGKMVLRMRIVDADTYQAASGPRLFLRYVAYFVSMLPLFLGFLWIAWDKRKQGWHDKIARTVVVRDA
jgi:uncharacterized RDD family membrane protein YckC